MSIAQSTYSQCIEVSERVAWKLGDVLPTTAHLDFGKTFMPSAMFDTRSLSFLSASEQRTLNQLFGNSYCYFFYFVETYIITLAIKHAQAELYGDELNLRAMLRFAEEEVKHQQMFLRFRDLFEREFSSPCDLVEAPQTVATVILAKSPMAVLLITLAIELVTQTHYLDAIRDSSNTESLFKNLFKHHWLEEAQHAKLDALELVKLHAFADEKQLQTAVDDYFGILSAFEEVFAQQASLDTKNFERATGRSLTGSEKQAIEQLNQRSYRKVFLVDAQNHPQFLEFLKDYFPKALERVTQYAERLP